jgi:D-alanyl-D-alanine carboxypeptidase (penicillin-binding protein 5/6)
LKLWLASVVLALGLMSGSASSSTTRLESLPPDIAPPDQAPIALLVDLSSGQTLYDRGGDTGFQPASVTKAMTALVVFDLLEQGRLTEARTITVRPETAARWAGKGSSLNLVAGEKVLVRDLLMGTTVVSANDAAIVLAQGAMGSTEAFVGAMNARARKLGMTGSHFGNPNGFPDRARTHVSARDLVKLAQAMIGEHPELYRRYIGKQAMAWRGRRLVSRDPFAGVVPGADGIKTGYTSAAGYNFLGTATRGGRRLVVVTARAPSESDRAAAARSLLEWGYSAFRSRPFLDPDWVVGSVRVQDGTARSVPVAPVRHYSIAQRRDRPGPITARIVYDGPVRAPITHGQPIARLEVSGPGIMPYAIPLVATRDVAKAGPIDRIVNGLLGLVE